jgi:hypothetical protein
MSRSSGYGLNAPRVDPPGRGCVCCQPPACGVYAVYGRFISPYRAANRLSNTPATLSGSGGRLGRTRLEPASGMPRWRDPRHRGYRGMPRGAGSNPGLGGRLDVDAKKVRARERYVFSTPTLLPGLAAFPPVLKAVLGRDDPHRGRAILSRCLSRYCVGPTMKTPRLSRRCSSRAGELRLMGFLPAGSSPACHSTPRPSASLCRLRVVPKSKFGSSKTMRASSGMALSVPTVPAPALSALRSCTRCICTPRPGAKA